MGKSRNSARVGGRKDNVMLDRNVQNSLYMHVTVHEQKKREKTKYIFKFESSLSIMLGSCLENEGKNILYLNCQIFPVSLPLLLFSSLSCHSPYKMQTHAKSQKPQHMQAILAQMGSHSWDPGTFQGEILLALASTVGSDEEHILGP